MQGAGLLRAVPKSEAAGHPPARQSRDMVEIQQTQNFKQWLRDQRGKRARGLVQVHVDRLHLGLPADVRELQNGLFEMRIEQGLGYRVYFVAPSDQRIVLLVAGDNRTQDRDIQLAGRLAINM